MKIKTNEILYRIQKALNLSTDEMIKAYNLENYEIDENRLNELLVRRQDDGFKICSYEELGVFLDGLVSLKRGKSNKTASDDDAIELTNNLILKKLRVALNLKEKELLDVFATTDTPLSKQQLASIFRNEQHKNYKPCSDEVLLSFLDAI